MSVDKEEESHICSFCEKTSSEVDLFIQGKDQSTLICDDCVRISEAIVAKRRSDEVDLSLIYGERGKRAKEKLRPITRMPKSWIICDSDLYSSAPSITACPTNEKKVEKFSIPNQLALWMISSDPKLNIDQIREKIRKDMNTRISETLNSY